MEHQNILNLLGNKNNKLPKFVTKSWVENDDDNVCGT